MPSGLTHYPVAVLSSAGARHRSWRHTVGLADVPHPLPARAGDQEKIVWRMTGSGRLTLTAIGPDGRHHRLAWGPDAHLGSNWDKPGDEWGAGYVFTTPGCWDLRAVRGDATADV
jgi:hypothetical protein